MHSTRNCVYIVLSQLTGQRKGVRRNSSLQNILLGHFLKIPFCKQNLVHLASKFQGKVQTSNKQTEVLTLPASFSHFINKDLVLQQQYKRAGISNFSNEIVLPGNSDSFQPQIAHTNEDGCYISRGMVGS